MLSDCLKCDASGVFVLRMILPEYRASLVEPWFVFWRYLDPRRDPTGIYTVQGLIRPSDPDVVAISGK